MNAKGVTSKGYRYAVCVDKEGPLREIGLETHIHVTIYKGRFRRIEVGFCSINIYDQTKRKQLEKFLDMSAVPDKPLCDLDVNILLEEDENKGFGSKLVETAISVLRTRDVVHIASFSDEGQQKLSEKCLAHGYQPLKFKPGAQIPRQFSQHPWLFYVYSETNR